MSDIKYIPILKLKTAELDATKQLSDSDKEQIIPLFEVVPGNEKEDKAKIEAEKLLVSCGDSTAFMLDTSLLFPKDYRLKYIRSFVKYSSDLYLKYFFVFSIYDIDLIKKVTNKEDKICIRITIDDLEDKELVKKALDTIRETINSNNLRILIDLKEKISADNYKIAKDFIKDICKNDDHCFLAIASGAFPKDMSKISIMSPLEEQRIQRDDYINWKNIIKNDPSTNMVIYSDYTIRHPVYDQSIEHYSSSATIKYTTRNYWQILKGQVNKNQHYIANAQLLINNTNEYFGEKHCKGDAFIKDKASQDINAEKIKPGNAKQWLCAGITHHIKTTIEQI